MIELGKETRLVDEASKPCLECLLVLRRANRHRVVAASPGQRARYVLLQRYRAVERVIEGEVDDAEAAFADDPRDFEFMNARTNWQRVAGQDWSADPGI